VRSLRPVAACGVPAQVIGLVAEPSEHGGAIYAPAKHAAPIEGFSLKRIFVLIITLSVTSARYKASVNLAPERVS